MDLDDGEAYDFLASGDFSSARRRFQDLSAHYENNSGSTLGAYQFNIASCHAKDGEYDKAFDILSQIETDGEDAGLIYNKALCLAQLGKFDLALICLDRISVDDLMVSLPIEQQKELAEALVTLLANLANLKSKYHDTKCKLIERLMHKLKRIVVDQLEDGPYMWQKNLAHVMFMMDTRYRECSQEYHSIMMLSGQDESGQSPDSQASPECILQADPVVVSNLCVSYILTGKNREAEYIIKEVEQEEEESAEGRLVTNEDTDLSSSLYGLGGMLLTKSATSEQTPLTTIPLPSASQLTRINLAIGTLYCVKNNYEFGLTRIFQALEPFELKLTQFTWNQAKRCILSLLDKVCRQLIHVRDDLLDQIVKFLIKCETHGVQVTVAPINESNQQKLQPLADDCNSVTYEARHLRAILLSVIHE